MEEQGGEAGTSQPQANTHLPWENIPAGQMEGIPDWWLSCPSGGEDGGEEGGGASSHPETPPRADHDAGPLWGRRGTLGQVDPELAYMASTDDDATPLNSPPASPNLHSATNMSNLPPASPPPGGDGRGGPSRPATCF